MRVSEIAQFCSMFPPALRVCAATSDGGIERRMTITKIGHHNPPDVIDDGVPVELFATPWAESQDNGLRVADLKKALADFPQSSDMRVAVPTDQGHHRCLAIHGLGFSDTGGPQTLELTVEAWNSPYQVVRNNPPE